MLLQPAVMEVLYELEEVVLQEHSVMELSEEAVVGGGVRGACCGGGVRGACCGGGVTGACCGGGVR